MNFCPVDRNVIYYFQPDNDAYSHYASTCDLLDLNGPRAEFVAKLKNRDWKNPIKTATQVKELYKEALLSGPKVIKATSPHPYRDGLSDEDLINLHLVFADTIDQEIEDLSKKSMFRRVASLDTLPTCARVWNKVRELH